MNTPLNTDYHYDHDTSQWYIITESNPAPSGFGIDI